MRLKIEKGSSNAPFFDPIDSSLECIEHFDIGNFFHEDLPSPRTVSGLAKLPMARPSLCVLLRAMELQQVIK